MPENESVNIGVDSDIDTFQRDLYILRDELNRVYELSTSFVARADELKDKISEDTRVSLEQLLMALRRIKDDFTEHMATF